MKPQTGTLIAAVLLAALCMPLASYAAGAGKGTGEGTGEEGPGRLEQARPGQTPLDRRFYTGLKVSYFASTGRESVWGPGLALGLVLVPRTLELEATVRALVGDELFSAPIDVVLKTPFAVTDWFVVHISAGPSLELDTDSDRTIHDWAAVASLGLGFAPSDSHWQIVLEGNYRFRFWQDTAHEGGGTIGFLYGF
ncbi:MAG: hypothetical protein PHU25_07760 [Deltaproteobacteria bacterium]|nr:hypothetical protein [Deltaproteobacteria bacterium]